SSVKTAAQRLRSDPTYTPTKSLLTALKSQQEEFNAETALRILKAIEGHKDTSCHRRQMVAILEMSLASKISGSYDSLTDSMIASIESIRQLGRKLPKY